jgi:hypothetical protein
VDRPFLRDTTPTHRAGPEHPSNPAPHENGIYMLACILCTSVLLLCVCVCVVSLLATSLSSLYMRSVGVSPALRLLLGSAVLCEFVVCRWCSASTAWVLSGVAPRYWVYRSLRFHVQIKVAGSRLSIHGARQSYAFHLRGACVCSLSNCLTTREWRVPYRAGFRSGAHLRRALERQVTLYPVD